jgi:hypothetical protein
MWVRVPGSRPSKKRDSSSQIFFYFATRINDTGGKFAAGVNDTGGEYWEQYQCLHLKVKL